MGATKLEALPYLGPRRRSNLPAKLMIFARAKPLGAAGALVIVALVAVALLAPLVAPYDPRAMDYQSPLRPPSWAHPLGTDLLGRDFLSRLVWGARPSLTVGFGSVLMGTTFGALWGLLSGFLGGKFDMISQRVVDTLLAFPTLVLALAIVASVGPSTFNVIVAIAVGLIPGAARIIRSTVLSIKERQFVEAAKAIGCGRGRIILLHIAPNCAAPYIIIASIALGGAILAEASLSFLGLGTQPPDPAWGQMLSGAGRRFAKTAPWLGIFPGLAISLAVFGFNLFGDALRDVLDPRLRKR